VPCKNREMGFENYRKVGISIGMREYHWICVFMICANKTIKIKKKREKDGENKSTGNKSIGTPLSSSPKNNKNRNLCTYQHM
jgi:hypothetical protein